MTNPLLKNSELKDYAVPFDRIKTEHFLPAIEQALQEARQNFALFKDSTADADFSNTIEALEFLDERLSSIAGIYSNLESAHASEEHRALAEKIYPLLTAWGSDVSLDEKLFSKVKYVYDHQNQWPLNQEQKKLLEKTYLSFVRNGALLSAEDKNKLRQIDQDLSVLGPKFSENVLKATNAFELWIDKKEDLAGLPEGVIEAAALSAKQKNQPNKWLFTLQAPSYIPFLTYAKNRDLREKLWRANSSKAYSGDFDNHSNIEKIIQLRHQRALLLGFKNHADFVLQERMAQSSTTVMDFLQKILVASKPAGLKDYQELKTFAAQMDGLQDLQAWDATYYAEKLREQKFSFSEEDLRPYFKLENVIEGVFLHAKKLYGLVFKENSTLPVYHPEVKAYEIFDESSGRYMGLFYTDFFPRETKKGGAWMTEFRSQGLKSTAENKKELLRPHVSIVCNFTKPTDSKPSLLNYDEVRTLFHEFGHALHSILSECTNSS
ncbi:MAG: M3 family metallopeptidase, partial [Pseudobdellovibrionaceae bacterium]